MRKETTDDNAVCELLDKLTLQSLHLMEEKLERRVALEAAIGEGTLHLAKSRYIMGQSSVSSLRLPTEGSTEFSASAVCHHVDQDGVTQLRVEQNPAEDTVNPIKWFGVLVPQNLHKAQSIFQSALRYAADCASVHIQLSKIASVQSTALKSYTGNKDELNIPLYHNMVVDFGVEETEE